MNDKLERIWKEVVVNQCTILAHGCRGRGETIKTLSHDGWCAGGDSNRAPPNGCFQHPDLMNGKGLGSMSSRPN
jgi:hypothetical protein